MKRILDLSGAILGIFFLGPVMLGVAAVIMLTDGPPFLFRQKRVGRHGELFTLYKFRSMPVSTPNRPSASAVALKVTPVGAVIRRTNLDELPQLFNILKGDMSIVGPRPALAVQTNLVGMRTENGALACRPGLTGLAQINAYDGMPETEKAAWDGKYASNPGFLSDMAILFRTFGYLTRKPPVY